MALKNYSVIEAGAAEDGEIYIKLRGVFSFAGGRPRTEDRWFCAFDSQRKEMLSVALTAITANLPVEAQLETPPAEYTTISRLYLKNG